MTLKQTHSLTERGVKAKDKVSHFYVVVSSPAVRTSALTETLFSLYIYWSFITFCLSFPRVSFVFAQQALHRRTPPSPPPTPKHTHTHKHHDRSVTTPVSQILCVTRKRQSNRNVQCTHHKKQILLRKRGGKSKVVQSEKEKQRGLFSAAAGQQRDAILATIHRASCALLPPLHEASCPSASFHRRVFLRAAAHSEAELCEGVVYSRQD